jgi:hypothetical protein
MLKRLPIIRQARRFDLGAARRAAELHRDRDRQQIDRGG